MDIIPQILTAKVMHHRFFPKKNKFNYNVYYLALPLPATKIPSKLIGFKPKDLGHRDGSDPYKFAEKILSEYNLLSKIDNIILITMPSILGYVFNPVSFYLCLDSNNDLRSVIAEVHNTFGQQHTYLCAHPDHKKITADDWLIADKVFHVSPFLERSGSYKFRFSLNKNHLGIWINYFDKDHKKQLATSVIGRLQPLTGSNITRAFWQYPLLTFKVIYLIHWQAVRLLCKKIGYINKPKQLINKISSTLSLHKNKKSRKIN